MAEYRNVSGYLVFDDWQMPDPHSEQLHEAMQAARYFKEELTQADLYRLLACVNAYIHFATHPAGAESVIAQLRQLRRAAADALRRAPAEPAGGQKP